MKTKFFFLFVGVLVLLSTGGPFVRTAVAQEQPGGVKRMTAKEKQKAINERLAKRKAEQKEKMAQMRRERQEKERERKQQLEEKRDKQRQLAKLKKASKSAALAQNTKQTDGRAGERSSPVNPPAITANKQPNQPNQNAQKKQAKLTDKKNNNKAEQGKSSRQNTVAMVPSADTTTAGETDRNKPKVFPVIYDVPQKSLLSDGFVKYGKLHQFHVRGINTKLYDVFVNGEGYTHSNVLDSNLFLQHRQLGLLPLHTQKKNIASSFVQAQPWSDFFRRGDYKSAISAQAYRDYVDDFNTIKTELKKEALSYRDFVGVLEVNPGQKRPSMQYELLDTTFYKSYYLLFVSRVDLLKDYYNALLYRIASVDTVRYREVIAYKQKMSASWVRFSEAKAKIDTALGNLADIIRVTGEYFKLVYADPVAYSPEDLVVFKQKFFLSLGLSSQADSAGALGVSNAIRAKIGAIKKRILSNAEKAEREFSSLRAYIAQAQNSIETYQKHYDELVVRLKQINDFVDRELSLKNRNVRFSELVENLYRRLMIEYETMRNNVKENLENMNERVNGYRDFLVQDFTYNQLQSNYEGFHENVKAYLSDSVYDGLSSLLVSTYSFLSDSSHFDVASKVKRIRESDFVEYRVSVTPKRHLPSFVVTKYPAFTQDFRLPVYGGIVHNMSIGLGTNVSFEQQFRLGGETSVNNNITQYQIVPDENAVKAKLHIHLLYNFFYRTKNVNFRYGGGAGLLLDFTDLLDFSRTKVLLGPSVQFYERFVLNAGITLGVEPTLRANFLQDRRVGALVVNQNINDIHGLLHQNRFAIGAFIGVGVSLF